jgi:hypothetical protein
MSEIELRLEKANQKRVIISGKALMFYENGITS